MLRVLIPQFEYEVMKLNEHEPAVLVKTNRLRKTKAGVPMAGGVIEDNIFSYQHFNFEPRQYHSQERNYKRREEFLVDYDWRSEL